MLAYCAEEAEENSSASENLGQRLHTVANYFCKLELRRT